VRGSASKKASVKVNENDENGQGNIIPYGPM